MGKTELAKQRDQARHEYHHKRELIEMMAPGTTPAELARFKREWLEPIEERIKQLEQQLGK